MIPFLILALLFAFPEGQQGLGSAAAIEGVANTDGGAPLPGVKIALDSLTKPQHFEIQTNATGRYAIENLSPGVYTVTADAKGFGCVIIPKVILEGGKRLKQDFEFLHGRKKLGCPTISQSHA
jgi:hypothetical protein